MRGGCFFAVGLLVVIVGFFGAPAGASGPPDPADANPPTGTVVAPLPGSWTSTQYPYLQVRFTDPDGIWTSSLSMTIDGASLTPSWGGFLLSAYAYGLSEGPHVAEATASDQLGNGPTVVSWTFSIDVIQPLLSITSPTGNPELADGSLTLAWSGSDAGSGIDRYEVRLDNGPNLDVGTATTFPFPDLSPGVHYFQVTVYDVAGNYEWKTAVATVPTASDANVTNRVTVIVPDQVPAWAVALVAMNAAEAVAIVWLAVRRRDGPSGAIPPPP